MNCDYCFYRDEMEKDGAPCASFMTEETLKNVIRKTILKSGTGISYAFQGGEPTLRGIEFLEKAVFYEKKYNRNQVPVSNSIQTNGLLLDGDWCDFLKRNHFLTGISLDGTALIHDAYRHDGNGDGTYDRVLEAACLLERREINFNILTVVTEKLAENISAVYELYKKKNFRYQQYIACMNPLGGELQRKFGERESGKVPYSLSPESYGYFLVDLFDLWKRDLENGKAPYIRQFDNYLGILNGRMPEACEYRGRCGFQHVVEADGSVYPCDFYVNEKYKLGNLNTEYLEDIDKSENRIRFMEKSLVQDVRCRDCEFFHICRGGCMRNRKSGNALEESHNYFCEGYQIFFAERLQQLQEISREIKM